MFADRGQATVCWASARARSPSTRARSRPGLRKRACLTFERAAAVPMAATTALRAIRHPGQVRAGHRCS